MKATGSATAATIPDGSGVGGHEKKISNSIFQARQIKHLHIELR